MNMNFLENQTFIITCLSLSLFRIYLEVIRYNFSKLPLTKLLPIDKQKSFHKWGFYLSVVQVVLFTPSLLVNT